MLLLKERNEVKCAWILLQEKFLSIMQLLLTGSYASLLSVLTRSVKRATVIIPAN